MEAFLPCPYHRGTPQRSLPAHPRPQALLARYVRDAGAKKCYPTAAGCDIIDAILHNKELEENEQIVEIMNYIGEKRGAISKGNSIDLEKVSRIILDDFRSGNLGKITLEKAN